MPRIRLNMVLSLTASPKSLLVVLVSLAIAGLPSLRAQTTNPSVEFGKNRIQYHNAFDEWMTYETDNFVTYWYGQSRNLGHAVVMMAEKHVESVQSILEHRLSDPIEIIVYKDLTDLKQSNIGSEQVFTQQLGTVKVVGNKIFVYFNGDHNDLERQVREGIATVYLNAMLFGSNLQEMVQNAVLLNLPDWFKDGLIAYAGQPWDQEADRELRALFQSNQFKNFERMADAHPRLTGRALWYFIEQQYGTATVSNLLYLTRINRSVEAGFLYVLGSSYESTIKHWWAYFKDRYANDAQRFPTSNLQALKFKNYRNARITHTKLSPDGRSLIVVTNEIGKSKVYLVDLATNKRYRILKTGYRNPQQATDYNYPLVAWNTNNQELSVFYEYRDRIRILYFDTKTKKKTFDVVPDQVQRIYSAAYINSGQLVWTAAINGFSDVFTFIPKTRQFTRITQDPWDDLDASYVVNGGRRGIAWSSNRPDTLLKNISRIDSVLPVGQFDIFFYNLDTRSSELVRVSNTPYFNEKQPLMADSSQIMWLSNRSGIFNREQATLEELWVRTDKVVFLKNGIQTTFHQDSLITGIDSAAIDSIIPLKVYRTVSRPEVLSQNGNAVLFHDLAYRTGKSVEITHDGKKSIISIGYKDTALANQFYYTLYQASRLKRQAELNIKVPAPSRPAPAVPIETPPAPPAPPVTKEPSQPVFETEFDEPVVDTLPRPTIDSALVQTPATVPPKKVDINNYQFQSEFDEEETPTTTAIDKEQVVKTAPEIVPSSNNDGQETPRPTTGVIPGNVALNLGNATPLKPFEFKPSRIVPYRLKFRTDFINTTLDNNLLFGGLEGFSGLGQQFNYPPMGILAKANFKELFEDYMVEVGIRIPTTFNGAEYFVLLDNKKKRIDTRYAIYRRSMRYTDNNVTGPRQPLKRQENTLLFHGQWRYPLDVFTSIRAIGNLRFDKTYYLATDTITLDFPAINGQRIGGRLEYVFDNTIEVSTNIMHGTRYKVFGEVVKRFQVDFVDNFSIDFRKGFMTVLGFDARHYQRLDKKSIFAIRLAGATSFGSEKNLYFLGGTENWVFPQFNNNIPFPATGNFAYQTIATSLRGFDMNIRNGNSFLLLNSEVRVPLLRYAFPRARNNFVRNFQVVGFFDMGTAWQGLTPFSDENPLNTQYLYIRNNNQTVSAVKVNYFRDPIVAGYGLGARVMLFGYFLRIDYGWGIETQLVQAPKLFLSVGTDF